MKKTVWYILFGLVGVLALILLVSRVYLKSLHPQYEGQIALGELKQPVSVIRDDAGVPHIEAKNQADAYTALGFVVAQDRLFQMELQRRLAAGRLAEVLGPKLVKVDKMARLLLFRRTAAKYLSQPEKMDPAALSALDHYIKGVNIFIARGKLPVEFKILRDLAGNPDYEMKPFNRVDMLSIVGYMAYSFADGIKTDSLRTIFSKQIPSINIKDLFPDYAREKPETIIPHKPKATPVAQAEKSPEATGGTSLAWNERSRKELWSFYQQAEEALDMLGPLHGSNSWVLGPRRTRSGKAILANDPHIRHSTPGTWMEIHLKYPGYENYGYHMPLLPFPLIAHNRIKGWALTMLENDDLDLYAETLDDPATPTKVKYKGKWVPLVTHSEVIKVRGGKDIPLEIRVTPHGPIVTDLVAHYKGKPLAAWWAYHHGDNRPLTALYKLGLARDWREFQEACALVAAPGLNISYADARGNIGWVATAHLPLRPKGVSGRRIMPGDNGKFDIEGFLPPEKNPRLFNPPSGMIITANNKPLVGPVDPYYLPRLTGYWRPSDRARRIRELLRRQPRWDLESLKKVQTDVYLKGAERMVAELVKIFEFDPYLLDQLSHKEYVAYEVMKGWDYRYGLKSAGASVFHFFVYNLLAEILLDDLGGKVDTEWIRGDLEKEQNKQAWARFQTYATNYQHWNFIKYFVRKRNHFLWDNVLTKEVETRGTIVLRAWRTTIAGLSKKLGSNPRSWHWSKTHQIEYTFMPYGMKAPLDLFYKDGPLPAPGTMAVINNMKANFGKGEYKVRTVPSVRRLVDFGNLEEAFTILPGGNSGVPGTPFYDDQRKDYLAGRYRTIAFTPSQIQDRGKFRLSLVPAGAKPKSEK